MSQSGYVHLEDVDVVKRSDSAMLLRYEEEEFWCPNSQIADESNYEEEDKNCFISITEWIANKNGIDI